MNSIAAGYLIGRLTNKRIIQMGTILLVIGTIMLARLSSGSSDISVYLGSSLIGLGMGFIMPMLMISIQRSLILSNWVFQLASIPSPIHLVKRLVQPYLG